MYLDYLNTCIVLPGSHYTRHHTVMQTAETGYVLNKQTAVYSLPQSVHSCRVPHSPCLFYSDMDTCGHFCMLCGHAFWNNKQPELC